MKVLVCGKDAAIVESVEAAVYDAGALPLGPVGNALAALGLADQERPPLAVVDLSAIDDDTGLWLAERLAERGLDLICLNAGASLTRLTLRYPDIVTECTDPAALADRIGALRGRRTRRPSTLPGLGVGLRPAV